MNKLISGIIAIGIYFVIIFFILMYYNIHKMKAKNYVEKNSNRVTVTLVNSDKTVFNKSSKESNSIKPQIIHHNIPKKKHHITPVPPKIKKEPKKSIVPTKKEIEAKRAKERLKRLEAKRVARVKKEQELKKKKEAQRRARIKREQEELKKKKEAQRLARIKREQEELKKKKEAQRLARIKREQEELKKKKEAQRRARIKREQEELKKKKEAQRLARIKREQEELKKKKEAQRRARIKREQEELKKKKEAQRLARIKKEQEELKKKKEAQRRARARARAEEERKKRAKNLFSSIHTNNSNSHSRPKETSRVKHTSSIVDRIKNTHQSGRVSNRNRERGVKNAYIAKVEKQLRNWNAQSNYKGHSAKIVLTIMSSGKFRYTIKNSTSMAMTQGLREFLDQLNRIGLGRHTKSTPYVIEVIFRAK